MPATTRSLKFGGCLAAALFLTWLAVEPSSTQAQRYVLFLLDFATGLIYPPVERIREVSYEASVRIAEKVFEAGLAGIRRPRDLRKFITGKMYRPAYR